MTIRAPIMIEAEPSGQEPNLRVNQTRRRRKRLALATTGLVAATALVTWLAGDSPTQQSLTGAGLASHQSVDPTRPLGAVIAASGVDTVAVWAALADSGIIVDQLPTRSRVTFRYQDADETPQAISIPLNGDRRVELTRSRAAWAAREEAVTWKGELTVLAGRIDDSLATVFDSGPSSSLEPSTTETIATTLTDLIAWRLSFPFEVSPGARLRVVALVQWSSDGRERLRDLYAIKVTQRSRRATAFRFSGNGRPSGFYDASGKWMGRSFLRVPLASQGRAASQAVGHDSDSVLGNFRSHQGVDIPAPTGTPVVAAGDGTVARATSSGDLGLFVDLRHKGGVLTRYGHLDALARAIDVGRQVRRGQVVGFVGQTGMASTPHLHYEFLVRGKPVDLRLIESESSPLLGAKARAAFLTDRIHLERILESHDRRR